MYVASAFRRTLEVRLKPDTTYRSPAKAGRHVQVKPGLTPALLAEPQHRDDALADLGAGVRIAKRRPGQVDAERVDAALEGRESALHAGHPLRARGLVAPRSARVRQNFRARIRLRHESGKHFELVPRQLN